MKCHILNYTREEIKASICSGVASPQALRDYDICLMTVRGKSKSEICAELNVPDTTVARVRRIHIQGMSFSDTDKH